MKFERKLHAKWYLWMILIALLIVIIALMIGRNLFSSSVEKKENKADTNAAKPMSLRTDYPENLLMMGDSLIFNPEDQSAVFSKNGHQVFAAVGSTLPQFFGVTEEPVSIGMKQSYVTGTIKDLDFNGIAILMGANDLAGLSAEPVFENYQKLLQELQNFTSVPIFVMKTFPSNQNYSRKYGNYLIKNERVQALNDRMSRYCRETDGLYFIDATGGFIDEDGLFQHDYGDGLHMDPAYYQLFYDNIIEAIQNLDEKKEYIYPEYCDESNLKKHWAWKAIRYVQDHDLLSGYSDGYFYPNVKISRGMFITALGRMADVSADGDTDTPFSDVAADHFAAPYIHWAAEEGIVRVADTEDRCFDPDGRITREQMAVMMDRFIQKEKSGESAVSASKLSYRDAEDISPEAVESVVRCSSLELLSGDQNQEFLPHKRVTRAEAATILMRLDRYMDDRAAS